MLEFSVNEKMNHLDQKICSAKMYLSSAESQ